MSNKLALFVVLVLFSYVICNCPSASTDKLKARSHVMKEIYSTEQTYVGLLKTLNEKVAQPVIKQKLLTDKLYQRYFSDINGIRPINEKLLNEASAHLQIEDEEERAVELVKTFSTYIPAFKLYIDFTKKYGGIESEIRAEMKNGTKFGKFLDSLATSNVVPDISSIYIAPVQRLPRYELLLCELAKTYTAGPDYTRVINAYNQMKQVTSGNNEKMRDSENKNKLIAINKQFKVPQVTSKRAFVAEYVKNGIKCGDGNPKAKNFKMVDCDVYLFNDILVVKKAVTLKNIFQVGLATGVADPQVKDTITKVESNEEEVCTFVLNVEHESKPASFAKFKFSNERSCRDFRTKVAKITGQE
ncbi:RacGEF [Acrasis kona]|uniref:RacGEF n=1 Tax=Acrasis kona TaxID=1008807 RepID=A0AAW2Z7G4_9EUKA